MFFKKFQKAMVIALVIASLTTVAALAAWQLTKETTGTGMVLGTFALSNLGDCGGRIVGEEGMCVVTLTNQYDSPVTVLDVNLETDRADISTRHHAWEIVSGVNPVPPGGTIEVGVDWYPEAGAPSGAISFTMYVTASAN